MARLRAQVRALLGVSGRNIGRTFEPELYPEIGFSWRAGNTSGDGEGDGAGALRMSGGAFHRELSRQQPFVDRFASSADSASRIGDQISYCSPRVSRRIGHVNAGQHSVSVMPSATRARIKASVVARTSLSPSISRRHCCAALLPTLSRARQKSLSPDGPTQIPPATIFPSC